MKLKEFDFPLPDDRIARFPSDKREESRLMMVNRATGEISHHHFRDIVQLTGPDDFFVINNTRVIPAKLFGRIGEKKVEMLVVRTKGQFEAEALTLPAKKFKPGIKVMFDEKPGLSAEVIETGRRGRRTLRFNQPFESVFNAGYAPLPPYIKRKFEDAHKFRSMDLERYQTVYAQNPGSIAAPTAGLHFTPAILEQLEKRSEMIEITLSVGEATFQKIEVEDIADHRMGRETITIRHEDRRRIRELKNNKNLIAVGTTSVRSLETWAQPDNNFDANGANEPNEPNENNEMGETFDSELFISPGFKFRMVDKLITNFHLPESSLFILISAFAGLELMQEAYRVAIGEGYRFFSYGDAMLIV